MTLGTLLQSFSVFVPITFCCFIYCLGFAVDSYDPRQSWTARIILLLQFFYDIAHLSKDFTSASHSKTRLNLCATSNR